MIPWTTQEISLLIGLWPNASAAQISKQLNRSRGSVCGKAMRLRRDDLLPADVEKHFEVNPAVQTRPGRAQTTVTSIMPYCWRRTRDPDTGAAAKPTPPVDATVPPPEIRHCSLLELRDGQCRWPLGPIAQVATLFCGGAVEPGRAYCGHHWRTACG
jgi:GcrA cell cycle regulator